MALTNEEVLSILKETGALKEGHFRLTSGLHSSHYVQCSQLLKFPRLAEKVCSALAEKFADNKPDLVVGPAIGGILVAYEVARALDVPALFAERENGEMTLRRGFTVEPGQKVIVTEDVFTTGGSAQEVVDLLQGMGAEVIAACSIIDRTAGNTVKLKVPYQSLIKFEFATYEEKDCPMCKEGKIPAIKPGSRPDKK
ncbi:MAG: orotate phosphoribosyltransferase [Peptococcaceae bacterium]|nr:orotate phosphoribosyltransferase [Peptococcaceae bacterium]